MNKIEKAREMRYKKAVLERLNYDNILCELQTIMENCSDIRWIIEGDEGTLIDALDGDEDEAFEFRMAFSDLSVECEVLYDLLNNEFVSENFNDFLAGVSDGSGMKLIGWDSHQEDYYALTSFEGQWGTEEARKRLERLTKKDIIAAGNQAFRIVISFLNITYKYDYISAVMAILKNENTAFLDVIRSIEEEYNKLSDDKYADWRNFDKIVSALPDRTWIE